MNTNAPFFSLSPQLIYVNIAFWWTRLITGLLWSLQGEKGHIHIRYLLIIFYSIFHLPCRFNKYRTTWKQTENLLDIENSHFHVHFIINGKWFSYTIFTRQNTAFNMRTVHFRINHVNLNHIILFICML